MTLEACTLPVDVIVYGNESSTNDSDDSFIKDQWNGSTKSP